MAVDGENTVAGERTHGIDTFWDDFEDHGEEDTDPEEEQEVAWYVEEEEIATEDEKLATKEKECMYCENGNHDLRTCPTWEVELNEALHKLREDLRKEVTS